MESGQQIVIARDGHPVAWLTAYTPVRQRGGRGAWKGEVDLGHFDEPNAEIAREFGLRR